MCVLTLLLRDVIVVVKRHPIVQETPLEHGVIGATSGDDA